MKECFSLGCSVSTVINIAVDILLLALSIIVSVEDDSIDKSKSSFVEMKYVFYSFN